MGYIMTHHAVTLNVPSALYERLERMARQTQRTVEAELLDVVATALPLEDGLSDDLSAALVQLALLDDAALWRAARDCLSTDDVTRMEDLQLKKQREGLDDAELKTLDSLVRQYERKMLIRARAVALLGERGHDISQLLAQV